jgi:cyclophilin family peptidyl-prolyl cis-trans isomerase
MKTFVPTLAVVALALTGAAGSIQAQEEKEETVSDSKTVQVVMETSKGTIKIDLDGEKAPNTVANFVKYVEKGHYDGLIFHRVIPDFMIQGGGFTPDMQQKKTDAPIEIESKNGLKNVRGSIAMARTSNPNSATSQFFINLKDNSFLDYPGQDGYGYTVFGKVSDGMDAVDAVAKAPTGVKGGMPDVPVETIEIKSVKIAE